MGKPLVVMAVAALLIGQAVSDRDGHRVRAQSRDPVATPAVEELVKQAIEDRLAAGNLPDGNLLGKSTRIAIRQEMIGLKLGPGALPRRDGFTFYFISQAAAQTEADRTRQPVPFITVDGASITDDTGMVSMGVDLAFPREPKQNKLCCCTGLGQFRRAEGRWTFVKWIDRICS